MGKLHEVQEVKTRRTKCTHEQQGEHVCPAKREIFGSEERCTCCEKCVTECDRVVGKALEVGLLDWNK